MRRRLCCRRQLDHPEGGLQARCDAHALRRWRGLRWRARAHVRGPRVNPAVVHDPRAPQHVPPQRLRPRRDDPPRGRRGLQLLEQRWLACCCALGWPDADPQTPWHALNGRRSRRRCIPNLNVGPNRRGVEAVGRLLALASRRGRCVGRQRRRQHRERCRGGRRRRGQERRRRRQRRLQLLERDGVRERRLLALANRRGRVDINRLRARRRFPARQLRCCRDDPLLGRRCLRCRSNGSSAAAALSVALPSEIPVASGVR